MIQWGLDWRDCLPLTQIFIPKKKTEKAQHTVAGIRYYNMEHRFGPVFSDGGIYEIGLVRDHVWES